HPAPRGKPSQNCPSSRSPRGPKCEATPRRLPPPHSTGSNPPAYRPSCFLLVRTRYSTQTLCGWTAPYFRVSADEVCLSPLPQVVYDQGRGGFVAGLVDAVVALVGGDEDREISERGHPDDGVADGVAAVVEEDLAAAPGSVRE